MNAVYLQITFFCLMFLFISSRFHAIQNAAIGLYGPSHGFPFWEFVYSPYALVSMQHIALEQTLASVD